MFIFLFWLYNQKNVIFLRKRHQEKKVERVRRKEKIVTNKDEKEEEFITLFNKKDKSKNER